MTSSKRKRIFAEGGLETESDEDRDIEIGLLVNRAGLATTSHRVHVTQNVPKRNKATFVAPEVVAKGDASTPLPPAEKKKRKQVNFFC